MKRKFFIEGRILVDLKKKIFLNPNRLFIGLNKTKYFFFIMKVYLVKLREF
jgi:hypothetical protein